MCSFRKVQRTVLLYNDQLIWCVCKPLFQRVLRQLDQSSVLIRGVPLFQGRICSRKQFDQFALRRDTFEWPQYRGRGLTTGVVSLQGWPHYRDGLSIGVVSLRGWSHYRGGLTTGVASLQGWPHYRGGLTTGVVSLQGFRLEGVHCPHIMHIL